MNTSIIINIPSQDYTTIDLVFSQSKSHCTWVDWGDNNHNQREIFDEVGVIGLSHTYNVPGEYNIELIVVDEGSIDIISIGNSEGYHNMITQVTIGDGVNSIGERVFSDCNNLEELYFSDTCLSEIKPYAFANCNSLIKIILPKDINLLDGVFYNCSGLKEVTLPDNISTIWTNTFSGCSQLKKVNVSEENNIYEVADYAFQGCRKLQNINFCKNVNIIGNSAFDSCSSLSDVEFTTVESIGNNAFCNCTFLMQANISSEIKDIGEGAFMNDKFLKVIKIGATKTPILHGMNAFNLDGDFTIKVPQGSKKHYIRETNWTVFADRIEEE